MRLDRAAAAAARLLVIGLAIAALLWVLAQILVMVVPVIMAVFLTALLMPVTRWLRDRGLNRALSTTAVWLLAIGVLALAVRLLGPQVGDGFSELAGSLDRAVRDVEDFLRDRLGLTGGLSEYVGRLGDVSGEQRDRLIQGAFAGAVVAGEVLAGLVLTVVLAVYFVYDGDRLVRGGLRFVPVEKRAWLREALDASWRVLGLYARGLALVGLVDAVLLAIVLLVLRVPLVVPLALLTFVGAFLPFVGAFLSGMLAALVALVAKGPVTALVVVVAAVLIQQLEGHVVAPQIYGRTLRLHPVVVILAIGVGAVTVGIVGAFLAVPVVAVVSVLLPRYDDEPDEEPDHRPPEPETEPGGPDVTATASSGSPANG